jgi:hypothetical protein
MSTFAKLATAVAIAVTMALSLATPGQAASRHHHRSHATQQTTTDESPYWNDDYSWRYDDSGYGAYAAAPYANPSDRIERNCMMSPGSQGYTPCFNN